MPKVYETTITVRIEVPDEAEDTVRPSGDLKGFRIGDEEFQVWPVIELEKDGEVVDLDSEQGEARGISYTILERETVRVEPAEL